MIAVNSTCSLEKAAKAEGAAEKALNKLKLRIAELAKMEAASVPPAELLKRPPHAAKYSAFGEDGRPTADAEGKPLEKKAPAMCPKAPVILTSFRTGRIAFVRSLLHKASKSIPSGALGGACRCVRRSNFSIHT